jgi:3-deoxy-manno-octulosonate cytidylyltransferase (CMP-KDO synthetase)
MTKVIGIIPARMGSTRFPGKPMEKIHGMPMIGHVYFRGKMSSLLDEVYVATCDNVIFDYIKSLGGRAVMTKDTHQRCSDRTEEALFTIERETGKTVDVVVMLQGDEPMITPEMLTQSIQPMLDDPSIQVLNLMSELKNKEEHEDPNEPKVVVDLKGNALYFSREAIPTRKMGATKIPMFKQVCVIPFRRDFLLKFSSLQPTPLEIAESIDMNRVLEHGYDVKMVQIQDESYAVDTANDLQHVEKLMRNDPLFSKYLNRII